MPFGYYEYFYFDMLYADLNMRSGGSSELESTCALICAMGLYFDGSIEKWLKLGVMVNWEDVGYWEHDLEEHC